MTALAGVDIPGPGVGYGGGILKSTAKGPPARGECSMNSPSLSQQGSSQCWSCFPNRSPGDIHKTDRSAKKRECPLMFLQDQVK